MTFAQDVLKCDALSFLAEDGEHFVRRQREFMYLLAVLGEEPEMLGHVRRVLPSLPELEDVRYEIQHYYDYEGLIRKVEILALALRGADLLDLPQPYKDLFQETFTGFSERLRELVQVGLCFDYEYVATRTREGTPDWAPWTLMPSRTARGILNHPSHPIFDAWSNNELHGEDVVRLNHLVRTRDDWRRAYVQYLGIDPDTLYPAAVRKVETSIAFALSEAEIPSSYCVFARLLPHLGHNVWLKAYQGHEGYWWVWENLDRPISFGQSYRVDDVVEDVRFVYAEPDVETDILTELSNTLTMLACKPHPRKLELSRAIVRRLLEADILEVMRQGVRTFENASDEDGNDIARVLDCRICLEDIGDELQDYELDQLIGQLDDAFAPYEDALYIINDKTYENIIFDMPDVLTESNGRWWGARARLEENPQVFREALATLNRMT